ncbi:hypothetical protein [Eubacterium oxidoreducens]|uniref:Uncharacterized protein n=1 Tax=Eubacterium oxidoreducens TaxID=1732 RepID=A0A1G6B2N7_EUBOX|nr:hypothetical protein [Eubacterium oxidoreducens]SDB14940.1 hypothetical protein SAMN02910417_01094 [Eubacterium oxidoreducens]
MEKTKLRGIMLEHSDGDFEYYCPKLTKEDEDALFKILGKYGDNNPSTRGDIPKYCHEIVSVLAED